MCRRGRTATILVRRVVVNPKIYNPRIIQWEHAQPILAFNACILLISVFKELMKSMFMFISFFVCLTRLSYYGFYPILCFILTFMSLYISFKTNSFLENICRQRAIIKPTYLSHYMHIHTISIFGCGWSLAFKKRTLQRTFLIMFLKLYWVLYKF